MVYNLKHVECSNAVERENGFYKQNPLTGANDWILMKLIHSKNLNDREHKRISSSGELVLQKREHSLGRAIC